jgi:hypothetical protein
VELFRYFCIVTSLQQQFCNLLLARTQTEYLFSHAQFPSPDQISRSANQFVKPSFRRALLRLPAATNPGLLYLKIHSIPTATLVANDAQWISTTAL